MRIFPRINPVTLKELRQLVRSRLIIWGMVVMPAFLLIVTTFVLAAEMHDLTPEEATYGKGLGEGTLIAASVITGFVVCVAIPLFAAIKTVLETGKDNMGLEFTTTLTPAQIVTGKITAVAMISGIAVALAMPFFVLSYLMRGVDLISTILTPIGLLAASVGMFSIGLLPACARRPVAIRIILLLLIFALLPTITSGIVQVFMALSAFGGHHAPTAVWMTTDNIALSIVGMLAVLAAVIAYCRAQAAAELSPQHLDYARPLRITQAAIFAVSFLLLLGELRPWVVLSFIMAVMIFLRAAYYPAPLTRGARQHAPKSFLLRLLAFPFATGSVPSMVFSLVITAIILPVMFMTVKDTDGNTEFLAAAFEFGGLLLIAGSAARLLVERNKIAAGIIGKVTLAYIVLVNALGIVAELDAFDKGLLHPLPCNIAGIDRYTEMHLGQGFLIAGAGLVLLTIVALSEFRKFRKP